MIENDASTSSLWHWRWICGDIMGKRSSTLIKLKDTPDFRGYPFAFLFFGCCNGNSSRYRKVYSFTCMVSPLLLMLNCLDG